MLMHSHEFFSYAWGRRLRTDSSYLTGIPTRRRDEVHFPDVPMLGSGLTGRVFAATLQGAPVAIKVTQRRPEGGSGVIALGEPTYAQVRGAPPLSPDNLWTSPPILICMFFYTTLSAAYHFQGCATGPLIPHIPAMHSGQ